MSDALIIFVFKDFFSVTIDFIFIFINVLVDIIFAIINFVIVSNTVLMMSTPVPVMKKSFIFRLVLVYVCPPSHFSLSF